MHIIGILGPVSVVDCCTCRTHHLSVPSSSNIAVLHVLLGASCASKCSATVATLTYMRAYMWQTQHVCSDAVSVSCKDCLILARQGQAASQTQVHRRKSVPSKVPAQAKGMHAGGSRTPGVMQAKRQSPKSRTAGTLDCMSCIAYSSI